MASTPLSILDEGEGGKVTEILAGRGLRQRLMAIGFGPGSFVKVLKKTGHGPIIVELKGCCKVGLGFGEASKIMVTTED